MQRARDLEVEDVQRTFHSHLNLERVWWWIFSVQIFLVNRANDWLRNGLAWAWIREGYSIFGILHCDSKGILVKHQIESIHNLSREILDFKSDTQGFRLATCSEGGSHLDSIFTVLSFLRWRYDFYVLWVSKIEVVIWFYLLSKGSTHICPSASDIIIMFLFLITERISTESTSTKLRLLSWGASSKVKRA